MKQLIPVLIFWCLLANTACLHSCNVILDGGEGLSCDNDKACLEGQICEDGKCKKGSRLRTDASANDASESDNSVADVDVDDLGTPDVVAVDIAAADTTTLDAANQDAASPDTTTPDTAIPDASIDSSVADGNVMRDDAWSDDSSFDCVDEDGDGHHAVGTNNCPTADDYCDTPGRITENNWTANGCSNCIDSDEDGRGSNCDMGEDCFDGDAVYWENCPSCADLDGDGVSGHIEHYCPNGEDYCDDDMGTHEANWTSFGCENCIDTDGDGRGASCDLGEDCEEEDTNNWSNCQTCTDADQDTHYTGCDRYVTIDGPDCSDSNPTIFPDAPEIPDDGIAQNCVADLKATDGPGIYVVHNATGCSDNAPGTKATPNCTITGALGQVTSSLRNIFVAYSTYSEAVVIDAEGVGVFGGYSQNGWQRSLQNQRATIDGASSTDTTVTIAGDNVVLQGFNISSTALDVTSLTYGVMVTGRNALLLDNEIHGGAGTWAYGLSVSGSTADTIFARNFIYSDQATDREAAAVVISGGPTVFGVNNVLVAGSNVNWTFGVKIWDGEVTLIGNTIYGGTPKGRNAVYQKSGVLTLVNNIMDGGADNPHAIRIESETGATIFLHNNDLYNSSGTGALVQIDAPAQTLSAIAAVNTCSQWSGGHCQSSSGNITVSPAFSNGYEINGQSPCQNQGTDPHVWFDHPLVETDVRGQPRPARSGWDMGAYEVQ